MIGYGVPLFLDLQFFYEQYNQITESIFLETFIQEAASCYLAKYDSEQDFGVELQYVLGSFSIFQVL